MPLPMSLLHQDQQRVPEEETSCEQRLQERLSFPGSAGRNDQAFAGRVAPKYGDEQLSSKDDENHPEGHGTPPWQLIQRPTPM